MRVSCARVTLSKSSIPVLHCSLSNFLLRRAEFRHLVHLTNDGGLERLSGKVKSPVFASARPLRYDGVQCRNCFHVSMTIGETKCALCHLALPRTSTASSGLGSPVAFACDMSDTNIGQPESVAKSEPELVDSDTSPTSRRRWMLGLRRGVTSPPSFGRPRRTTTDSGVRFPSPHLPAVYSTATQMHCMEGLLVVQQAKG
jgi:hypothetical protein